jgi:pimeloyl-ACP methyl ester carboxylesterase
MYLSFMTDNTSTSASHTRYLDRPSGRIAYEVSGEGPLVVLVPGLGDLRAAYRFLAPRLVAAGYRVALTDLRGHGESDPTFDSYGDPETAGDIEALVGALGGPAVVVGNSMGAGAAVYAAAEHPELIAGLVLVGPFVRDGKVGVLTRALMRVAMAPAWAATSWKAYVPRLYAGRAPVDYDAYVREVVASLRRPGYARAFSRTTRLSHAPAEARLGKVHAPTLVVMGDSDPDFADPKAEADWIAAALHGTVVMVPDAGHYPQSQQPDLVADAVLAFLAETTRNA